MGLVENSGVVLVASMLVSPLMEPILAGIDSIHGFSWDAGTGADTDTDTGADTNTDTDTDTDLN